MLFFCIIMSWLVLSVNALALVLCFCLLELRAIPVGGRGSETDQAALLEFKSKISNDPFGVLNSWNESIHFCLWHGVTCSRRHQRVTILNLKALQLEGTLSPQIGNLSFLQKLNLGNNSFTHEIPSQIGRLRRLRSLFLQMNSFGGEIPASISNCTNLISINIAANHLMGKIPSEFGSFPNIILFSATANNLTGSIPSSLGNLSTILTISLSRNNFTGSIPDTFGQLKNLQFLSLVVNNLSGKIPSSIFNISSIQIFDAGSNKIQGAIPFDMGITLPNLQIFSVTDNEITGTFPPSIANATNLELFQVSENYIAGKVPDLERLQRLSWFIIVTNNLGSGGHDHDDLNFICSLINATNLERLYVNNNNFGGLLPGCITNLSTNLQYLLIDNNKIFGSIPTEIGKFVNLQRLDMWNNQLSGTIPPSIGELQNLGLLYLHENTLSGNIPHSIGNLKKLLLLYLSSNNLQGSIPSSLGQCESLTTVDFSYNNLSGNIPAQFIGPLSVLIVISLSRNQLTGSLPTEVGNLKNLENLDVSGNMLEGEIPSSIGGCIRLEQLHMNGNLFQGHIPSSFRFLRGLKALDLSQNNLSGEIPEFLEGFEFFQNLNLSYNELDGMVPTKGVFKNESATSIQGNRKLCGGIPEFQLPICGYKKSKHGRMSLALKLVILIVSVLVGLALALSSLFLCWVKRRKQKPNPTSTSLNSLLNLSYQNLYNATDRFSSTNLLGAGSFGSVYKGILDEGKTIVAVKVFNLLHHGAFKSFVVECNALRNIRHRNLVKVLTACSGVDYQGNDFKALVYELMPNGSLEDWLHPVTREDESSEASRSLNLLQRLNIAIDVACALNYLHHDCQPPTAHCDLKPSNVLLDIEMTAHVSDFGLARFLSPTHKQTSSIAIKGSIGYIAPEYGLGGEVSTNGDIYSYGILLLEMFTRKRPTDKIFEEDLNLHKFARMALPDHLMDIVDPIICYDNHEDFAATNHLQRQGRINNIMECLISIVRIGVACSMESPQDRMNITNVMHELQSIRNILMDMQKGS